MPRRACATAALVFALAAAARADREPVKDPRALVELGRRLFFDPTASSRGRLACADCHHPDHGFAEPRPLAIDADGPMRRNAMALVDLAQKGPFHADGEFLELRDLIRARLAGAADAVRDGARTVERQFDASLRRDAQPDARELARRLAELGAPYGPRNVVFVRTPFVPTSLADRLGWDGRYARSFERAFGAAEPSVERATRAIEAYVLSLETSENAYDRYARGDRAALADAELRGLALFAGKAGCAECHPPGRRDERATFTDRDFHNTGLTGATRDREFPAGPDADAGRGRVSFVPAEIGAFKTPSLRDVGRTAPYMHDGSLTTLADVVGHYNRGGVASPGKDRRIRPLGLTESEVADLVAFLYALDGDGRPGLAAPPEPRIARLRIVDLDGRPRARLEVRIDPFGDRFFPPPDEPLQATTDDRGWLRFVFPPTTHVKLESELYEIGLGRPIPDDVPAIALLAAPKDLVVLPVYVGARSMPVPLPPALAGESLDPDGDAGPAPRELRFRFAGAPYAHTAVYAAPARGLGGIRRVRLALPQEKKPDIFELDLRGGATEPIFRRRGPREQAVALRPLEPARRTAAERRASGE